MGKVIVYIINKKQDKTEDYKPTNTLKVDLNTP